MEKIDNCLHWGLGCPCGSLYPYYTVSSTDAYLGCLGIRIERVYFASKVKYKEEPLYPLVRIRRLQCTKYFLNFYWFLFTSLLRLHIICEGIVRGGQTFLIAGQIWKKLHLWPHYSKRLIFKLVLLMPLEKNYVQFLTICLALLFYITEKGPRAALWPCVVQHIQY